MAIIQAGSVLACQFLNGNDTDIICSKDMDFPSLVGPSCIMLRNLQFKQGIGKNKGKNGAMLVTGIKIGGGCDMQFEK
eukprot:3811521-Ditylum_brightwellii.AAC.1